MSSENVGVVESAFAAYRDGGIDAALPLFDWDVVWYFDADELVEDLAYRGHDGLRAAHAVWVDNLDDFGWDLHEIEDHGEKVLVVADITGVGRDTGAPARLSTNLLVDVREGVISEVHTYTDHARALEATERKE